MTTSGHLPSPTDDFKTLTNDLDQHGYCLVADALSAEQLDKIRERLAEQALAERQLDLNTRYQAEAEGDDVNQWIYNLINKGEEFWTLPRHATVQALARHVLGQEMLLSSFDAHITYPNNKQMPMHTDQWWMPQPALPTEQHWRVGDMGRQSPEIGDPVPASRPIAPPMVVNVMWMLNEFTADNGATRIVPGSHLSGLQPDPERDYDPVVVAAPAGTALLWEGRTWHAAGLNVGNTARYGAVTLFAVPIVRQLTNFTYGTRPEVRPELPDDLLDLMGFQPWEGYGLTDDSNAAIARPGTEVPGRLTPREA
tara:strand:+ start:6950 stop:7879 length:930 start_codon:yes stop_codon:yes gene_type:complete